SGENLFVVLLISAPISHELKPPANPVRFITPDRPASWCRSAIATTSGSVQIGREWQSGRSNVPTRNATSSRRACRYQRLDQRRHRNAPAEKLGRLACGSIFQSPPAHGLAPPSKLADRGCQPT